MHKRDCKKCIHNKKGNCHFHNFANILVLNYKSGCPQYYNKVKFYLLLLFGILVFIAYCWFIGAISMSYIKPPVRIRKGADYE